MEVTALNCRLRFAPPTAKPRFCTPQKLFPSAFDGEVEGGEFFLTIFIFEKPGFFKDLASSDFLFRRKKTEKVVDRSNDYGISKS
jgi:hypothetical protein